MDPSALVISIVGILLTIVLGFLSNRTGKVLDGITEFKEDLIELKSQVKAQSKHINFLLEDYNKRREAEIQSLRNKVKDYESR